MGIRSPQGSIVESRESTTQTGRTPLVQGRGQHNEYRFGRPEWAHPGDAEVDLCRRSQLEHRGLAVGPVAPSLGKHRNGGLHVYCKLWLVTGSAASLGRHIADPVLAAGDRLVATAHDPGRLKDLIRSHGDKVRAALLDVADEEASPCRGAGGGGRVRYMQSKDVSQ
jgi:hypothetical protein